MTRPTRRQVMSPQTRAALGLPPSARPAARPWPAAPRPAADADADADADGPHSAPEAGMVVVAVVLRVQRRLAIRTMSLLIGGLILLPAVLTVAPGLQRARIAGLPVLWLLLGVAIYPALLLLAAQHRRAVDRLEAAVAQRDARAPD